MKVKLLRDCKPFGRTGEIVEVSPAHFDWLVSLGFAVPVTEAREQAEAPKAEKPAEKAEEDKEEEKKEEKVEEEKVEKKFSNTVLDKWFAEAYFGPDLLR